MTPVIDSAVGTQLQFYQPGSALLKYPRDYYGVPYSRFESVVLKSRDTKLLLGVTRAFKNVSSKNIYKRIKQLGDIDTAMLMIDESQEKWASALRNMK